MNLYPKASFYVLVLIATTLVLMNWKLARIQKTLESGAGRPVIFVTPAKYDPKIHFPSYEIVPMKMESKP